MTVRESLNDFTEQERHLVDAWYAFIDDFTDEQKASWAVIIDWLETNAVLQYISEQEYNKQAEDAKQRYEMALEAHTATMDALAEQQAIALERMKQADSHYGQETK